MTFFCKKKSRFDFLNDPFNYIYIVFHLFAKHLLNQVFWLRASGESVG